MQLVQQYRWKAVNAEGQSFGGVYKAASRDDAAAYVRTNYGYLTFLQCVEAKPSFELPKLRLKKCGLGDEEKAVFFSQLALMLDSGLPVLKALQILEKRLPRKTAQLCKDMQRELQCGESLAECMNKNRAAWGSLAGAVIAAGEAGGILCEMLDELAKYYQLQAQMKRFIKNISLYPLFLLTVSFAVALMFIVKVLPLFADLYASMNAEIPAYLNFMFAVQGALADNLPVFLTVFAAVAVLAVLKQQALMQALFAIPFLKVQKQLYLEIRFNKVLALLLHGGIPLPQAAQIAGEALGDAGLKQQAENFAADVLRGTAPEKAALNAGSLFGSLSMEFIGVGAETGHLPEMLARAAELLQIRFDDTLKNLKVVLEPLLLLFVAAFVSAIILAVAAPMFSLSGALPGY